MEQTNKINIPLFPILLVNFIGTLGFSIVLPFLVFVVTRFGGNALVYGIMGAVYPAFQLIGAPVLGRWSDIYGRKKILFLSQAGTVAGWIIFVIAVFVPVTVITSVNSSALGIFSLTFPLILLFLSRAVDGITGGNISVANAYLADITDEKNRNRNFGKMSVSSNLGFIAGPALAGLLGATVYGELIPILATVFLSLAAAVLIWFYLPESKPAEYSDNPNDIKKVMGFENKECFKQKDEKKIELKEVFKIPYISFILFLYFLIFLGFNFFYTAFPIHVLEKMKWTISQMGIYYSVLSLLMVIVQGPVLSRVSKKLSESVLIVAGNFILGITFLMLLSENTYVIFGSTVFFALGNGLMWPSVLSLLSKAAGKKYQGSVQGFAGSLGSLASIIGLVLGGILYSAIGAMTFLISAGVIYLVFVLSFRLLGIQKQCDTNAALERA
ncbi:MAG: MFS transporter [Chlorobi bacterium]|nr:MFS transporter [Chlorobiota bacterium]MCI0715216.1 MFS transporter [Chlorobiota bacterium]